MIIFIEILKGLRVISISWYIAVHFIEARSNLTQVVRLLFALMNCNGHETLAFNNVSSHGDNPRR